MAGRQTDQAARLKRYVMRLLRRGSIDITEAAYIASADRATVWRWCEAERLDVDVARRRFVMALRDSAERHSAGQGVRDDAPRAYAPRSGPSRAQLQRIADYANKSFRTRSKKDRQPC